MLVHSPPALTRAAPATESWRQRLAILPRAILVGLAAVMCLGVLAYAFVVPWTLLVALVLFLAGPDFDLTPSPLLALVALPPLIAIGLTLAWIIRRVRGRGWPVLPSPSLTWERDWLGWRTTAVALALALAGYLAYARLVFLYARIQGAIDEGLYLYAARLAMSGQIPYRDFYFDQAPLVPYALGLALGPFAYDEVAARLFAIACTLLTIVASFLAAARLGGRLAGLLAVGLLVTCIDFMTELSGGVQSNGGLTALVVALVALALAYDRLAVALVLACAAAGLRQSFVPLALVVACHVGLARSRPWLAVLAGILPVALIYGLSLVVGGDAAPYALLRPLRQPFVVRMTAPMDIVYEVSTFRDLLIRVLTAYFPSLLCAGPVAYVVLRRGHARAPVLLALAAACATLLIADLLPYEDNARYPVTLLPLAAVLGGVSVAALLGQLEPRFRPALVAGMAALLSMAPAIAFRDANFVAQFENKPPLRRFVAAAAYVRSQAPPDGVLVTLETPFASQTGLRVPRGLEAGSWGIYKGISTERARQLGVITYPMLADMVEQGVGDIVIESDRYGMVRNYYNNDDQKRRVEEALKARYEMTEAFGQVSDWGDVRVWIKRR